MDLNCDLGEGFGAWRMGDDDALLSIVTSANVACGFHAGDPLTMLHVLERAAERGVAVGAHVAYRDLAGFGRREMAVGTAELRGDVLYQLAALDGLARTAGTRVAYVKPHGALYNRIQRDPVQASAVAAATAAYDRTLPLLGMPGSAALAAAADRGLPVRREAFADRGYAPDGSLIPRSEPGAVLTDPHTVAARARSLAVDGLLPRDDGPSVPLVVDSLCVHSDTPGAVALAGAVRAALEGAGVEVRPFG